MEYRQLAEKSPTSILVVRNGNILYTNPAFSVFSGYNNAEIIGKDLLSFVNPSDHEEFTNVYETTGQIGLRLQTGVSSGLSQNPERYG